MNDHPFEALPPAPDDLWPKVSPMNLASQSLLSDSFPAPLPDVAGVLGRAVRQEMQNAGEYAAKAATPPPGLRPHEGHLRKIELGFHRRLHTESAARILHFYGIIHAEVSRPGPTLIPTPDQLKEAATKVYRVAVRDEMALQREIQILKGERPGFNDELFAYLKKKAPVYGAKFHR